MSKPAKKTTKPDRKEKPIARLPGPGSGWPAPKPSDLPATWDLPPLNPPKEQ